MSQKIPTYVVNLKSDKQRKEWMQAQLLDFPELSTHFFEAVDGRTLSPEQLKEAYNSKYVQAYEGRDFTRGEIGCSLSHIGIYNMMVERSQNWSLIIEDDAWLSTDVSQVLDRLVPEINTSEPKVILLTSTKKYLKRPAVLFYNKYSLKRVHIGWGTLAYLINAEAAKRISGINYPVRFSADGWKYFKTQARIAVYCVDPILIVENTIAHPSTIEAERKKVRKLRSSLISRIKRALNKIANKAYELFWLHLRYGIQSHSSDDIKKLSDVLREEIK